MSASDCITIALGVWAALSALVVWWIDRAARHGPPPVNEQEDLFKQEESPQ